LRAPSPRFTSERTRSKPSASCTSLALFFAPPPPPVALLLATPWADGRASSCAAVCCPAVCCRCRGCGGLGAAEGLLPRAASNARVFRPIVDHGWSTPGRAIELDRTATALTALMPERKAAIQLVLAPNLHSQRPCSPTKGSGKNWTGRIVVFPNRFNFYPLCLCQLHLFSATRVHRQAHY